MNNKIFSSVLWCITISYVFNLCMNFPCDFSSGKLFFFFIQMLIFLSLIEIGYLTLTPCHFHMWLFATCWLKWLELFQSLQTLWYLTSSEILSALNRELKGCSDSTKCSGINIKWGLCSHCTLGLHPACIAYFFPPPSCMS